MSRAAEKEQELHVLQRVSEVNHILEEVDCHPIRLEYTTKHSSKFHPMVTEMSCSNAASSKENPYAVVPGPSGHAVASRWGLIIVQLWKSRDPLRSCTCGCEPLGSHASVVNGPVVVSHLLTVEEVVVLLGILPFRNDVLIVLVCSNRRVLEAHVHRRIF